MAENELKEEEKTREELLRELSILRTLVRESERVEQQRQKAEESRSILLAISEAVHRTRNLDELYGEIHRSLGRAVYARNFYIALYYEETGLYSFPYAVDEAGDEYDPRPHDLTGSMTALVLRTGKPLLADEEKTHQLAAEGQIRIIGSPAASWIGVPLVSNGTVIGVMVVQSYRKDILYTEDDVQMMSFVSEQIATAIERKAAEEDLAAAYERIKHDLRMASRVQSSMLPRTPPTVPGWEFAWLFRPCEEIAGDMFNVFPLGDGLIGFFVLDVAGHGMQAALLSVTLNRVLMPTSDGTGILRVPKGDGVEGSLRPPAEVAALLNRHFPLSLETNQFFTLLYGYIETSTGRVCHTLAGHPAPVLRRGGKASFVESVIGPSIGIVADANYKDLELQLERGDSIILQTDGVEEAQDIRGEEFGRNRVLGSLSVGEPATAEELIRGLDADLRRFTRGTKQGDDVTLLCIRRLPL